MHPSISSFTFGAEFEVLLPPTLGRELAASEFTRISGLACAAHISTVRPGEWKVVSDGSLRGRGMHGLEFVSPILSGDEGLEQVQRAARALHAMGAKVNQTCGFHVHVGNHGGDLDFFKSLVKLYGRFEQALDSIMPASRRGNAANYCRSVALGLRDVDSCNSKEAIAQVLARASCAHAPKYHKVNIVPHGKPTVEFRHHAGTVDAAKARNWVTTCLRLVAAAKAGKTGDAGARAVRAIAWDLANLRGKQLHVASLVARPEGATNEEVRFAFGYATISARKQLRDAGFSFRTERDRATGKDRFFAVVPTEPVEDAPDAPFPTTLDGLVNLIEASPEEREFFARRARVVSA